MLTTHHRRILPPPSLTLEAFASLDTHLSNLGARWDGSGWHCTSSPDRVLAGRPCSPVVLSYGMGVESTAILLRWLTEPSSRDFDLDQLTVLTAQTGDEFFDLEPLFTTHVLPLLMRHNVRFVQVCRAGAASQDGIVTLGDSSLDGDYSLHLKTDWSLSDELLLAGTVPQVASGRRLCSLKFKGFVLDTWLEAEMRGRPFRHCMGFNSAETRRIDRDSSYSTVTRQSQYPLLDWGWDRAACVEFIRELTGASWPKSCCSFCPFAFKIRSDDMADHISRLAAAPDRALQALLIEHVSLQLNPRMTLFASCSLRSVLLSHPATAHLPAAFDASYAQRTDLVVVHVRRLYRAAGIADRCTRHVSQPGATPATLEAFGPRVDGRVWVQQKATTFPCAEEFYALVPAFIAEKSRPGFERSWNDLQKASRG